MIMIVLASCTTPQQGMQTTERLQSVEVSPAESLSFPYLESILIQENDLLPGYSAGKISHKLPTYYEKIVIPDADYVIRLQIQKESVSGGQVMVFYYAIQGLHNLLSIALQVI